MFEGEQTSLTPALSGGGALISPWLSNIYRCRNGAPLLLCMSLFCFCSKFLCHSSIFDLFHAIGPIIVCLYDVCEERESYSLVSTQERMIF